MNAMVLGDINKLSLLTREISAICDSLFYFSRGMLSVNGDTLYYAPEVAHFVLSSRSNLDQALKRVSNNMDSITVALNDRSLTKITALVKGLDMLDNAGFSRLHDANKMECTGMIYKLAATLSMYADLVNEADDIADELASYTDASVSSVISSIVAGWGTDWQLANRVLAHEAFTTSEPTPMVWGEELEDPLTRLEFVCNCMLGAVDIGEREYNGRYYPAPVIVAGVMDSVDLFASSLRDPIVYRLWSGDSVWLKADSKSCEFRSERKLHEW